MSVVNLSVVRLVVLSLALGGLAAAHVGSPDVFFQGNAGPYQILVAIRPPDVIPGVAHVEIRALTPGAEKIELTPMPMTGEGARHPPVADLAQRSAVDPNFYEGGLWLMGFGSWQVKVRVSGPLGTGELPVPVPALALKTRPMNRGTEYFLFGMMLFLTVGMVAIVGAGVRESQAEPGLAGATWSAKSIAAMLVASSVLFLLLWKGNSWWGEEAADHARQLYKPLGLVGTLEAGERLQLELRDPGWLRLRKLDDLLPDHGHLMHLFLLRWPAMDRVYHLHPEQAVAGSFATDLPAVPAGTYRVYGDIVHESGLAETATGEIALPDVKGKPLGPDDGAGAANPVGAVASSDFSLGGGYRMVWKKDSPAPVRAKQVRLFAFEIVGPAGSPVDDLQPYMGMGGHAEFVKTDGSVFAHVHPTGSVPMAAVAIASNAAMLRMHESKIGTEVSFPYGVPTPGQYRIFVQMKREGKVETGVFDLSAQ